MVQHSNLNVLLLNIARVNLDTKYPPDCCTFKYLAIGQGHLLVVLKHPLASSIRLFSATPNSFTKISILFGAANGKALFLEIAQNQSMIGHLMYWLRIGWSMICVRERGAQSVGMLVFQLCISRFRKQIGFLGNMIKKSWKHYSFSLCEGSLFIKGW